MRYWMLPVPIWYRMTVLYDGIGRYRYRMMVFSRYRVANQGSRIPCLIFCERTPEELRNAGCAECRKNTGSAERRENVERTSEARKNAAQREKSELERIAEVGTRKNTAQRVSETHSDL